LKSAGERGNHSESVKHRADVLEALVELYFRLNGFFCIRNYLQHLVDGFGLAGESDLLAIRMPYQVERLENGRRQRNDTTLILPEDPPKIDCIIAEVKEPSVEFNAPVRRDEGKELIAGALRMFGVLPHSAFGAGGDAYRIVDELHLQVNQRKWPAFPTSVDSGGTISFRMLVFAPRNAKHANTRLHADLQHVLDFTRERMRLGKPCAPYRDLRFPKSSPWRGATRLVVEVLDQSGADPLLLPEFMKTMLDRWSDAYS
jgi:hypothetical protein